MADRQAPPDALGCSARGYELGLTRVLFRRFERVLLVDEWIAKMLSVSSTVRQPDEDRAGFSARLRELIPPRGVRHRFRTIAYWTPRA